MNLDAINAHIVECRRCPRLVAWRKEAARNPPARFAGEHYWARPVPGFGDPTASVLIVGLAPAAHGGNRTGRVFTGDASGDFLWHAMHAIGLANQAEGRRAGDGLRLDAVRVVAAVRCAPPANKPTPDEQARCRPYLARELELLRDLRVIVPLGAIGWDAALRTLSALGHAIPSPKPRFAHAGEARVGRYTLLGSYHPSQQNTFTGKLTQQMLQDVLRRARELAGL